MCATDEQIIFFGKICPKAITFFSNVWSVIRAGTKVRWSKVKELKFFFFLGGGGEHLTKRGIFETLSMREGLLLSWPPPPPFLLVNGKWKPFIYIYSYEVKEIRSPLAHDNDKGFMATLAVTRHDVQNLIVQSYYCKNQESKLFSRFNIYYGRLTSVRLENSVWKYLAYKLHNFFKVITSMYPTLIFRQ